MIMILLIILGICICLEINDKKKKPNIYDKTKIESNKQDNKIKIKDNEKTEFQKYYKKKRYITTKSESKFYSELLKICKKYNLILLTQVALYELIEVNLDKNNKEYLKYFNKIKSKTIDFVIVDEETTRIRLCIELDDYTHKYKNRIERDNFINTLFKELEIDLIRIKSIYNCNYEELEKNIKNICTDDIYAKE